MEGGSTPGPYPDQWVADVVTADGGTVHVRPIRPDDGDAVVAFHARQSPESIYFRFFSPRPRLSDREVDQMTHVDYCNRMGLVAELGDEIVGIARYDRWPERDEAEAAFFVDDAHIGRGYATILLEYIVASARAAGLSGLTAQVLPSNRRMLSVLRQAGFGVTSQFADGVIEVRLSLDATPAAEAAMEERARRGESRSVARFLAPSSVAVIGASRRPGSVGHELFRNLSRGGFAGPVYAVNPGGAPEGAKAYASVLDIVEPVDLALIAVPAAAAVQVLADCAEARVPAVVVIGTGFSDAGPAGAAVEHELIGVARSRGVRVLGPGSMGVVNTSPEVRLLATAVPVDPRRGAAAIGTEFGALGAAILDRAQGRGIGLSSFVSVGNRADISANDLLRYWEDDDDTRVVLLHVGSFGDPRRFGRIAQHVSARKPVVAVRGHPGAFVDALLRQTGIIRVDTLDQMLDVGRILSTQPWPAGDGLAIIGNAPDANALAIDAIEAAGARVALCTNLGPSAPADVYGRAVAGALAAEQVDGAIVVYAPPLPVFTDDVGRAVAAAAARFAGKPVAVSFLHTRGDVEGLPNFTFPDSAASALAVAGCYGRWRAEPDGVVPPLDRTDLDLVRGIVDRALAEVPRGGRLPSADAFALLGAWGIDAAVPRLAHSAEEAIEHARAIGGAVALKATGLAKLAKTEAGGVAVDLHGPSEVGDAYERMRATLGDAMVPAVVQPMVTPGIDVRVGAAIDPTVGPVVSFGLGGAGTDLEPISPDRVRIVPLTDLGAARLVDTSTAVTAMTPDDRAATEGLLVRVAQLVEAVPEVSALYLNPVIVSGGVATVVDALVRVAPWAEPQPRLRRIEPS